MIENSIINIRMRNENSRLRMSETFSIRLDFFRKELIMKHLLQSNTSLIKKTRDLSIITIENDGLC